MVYMIYYVIGVCATAPDRALCPSVWHVWGVATSEPDLRACAGAEYVVQKHETCMRTWHAYFS